MHSHHQSFSYRINNHFPHKPHKWLLLTDTRLSFMRMGRNYTRDIRNQYTLTNAYIAYLRNTIHYYMHTRSRFIDKTYRAVSTVSQSAFYFSWFFRFGFILGLVLSFDCAYHFILMLLLSFFFIWYLDPLVDLFVCMNMFSVLKGKAVVQKSF